MSDDETIGARIRRFRRARGLSLDQAAGLAGISKPYLSRLERGQRSIDSRSLLLHLAQALEVSVSDLTGQPYVPRDREHADAQRGVSALRLALLDPSGPAAPEDVVSVAVSDLPGCLEKCDLVEQGRILPGLLRATMQYADTKPPPAAFLRRVSVGHAVTFFLRNLGETDLALISAERMLAAARTSEDPAVIGFASFGNAHALAPAGAVNRSVAVALAGCDASGGGKKEQLAARGSCLLVAASSNAALREFDTARAQVEEASGIAASLTSETVVAGYTSFSTWNATMHRVAVEVEAGNSLEALRAARPLIDAKHVAQRERMSYLWVDVGRAYSQLDRHREAIDAFRRAERSAPLRVRLSPVVRDSVRDLMARAYRRAAGVELRGLAERCGVLGGS
jgi:transcriptional regulator with XRE-family HTH domain